MTHPTTKLVNIAESLKFIPRDLEEISKVVQKNERANAVLRGILGESKDVDDIQYTRHSYMDDCKMTEVGFTDGTVLNVQVSRDNPNREERYRMLANTLHDYEGHVRDITIKEGREPYFFPAMWANEYARKVIGYSPEG